jgi:hypothetical protein
VVFPLFLPILPVDLTFGPASSTFKRRHIFDLKLFFRLSELYLAFLPPLALPLLYQEVSPIEGDIDCQICLAKLLY